METVLEHRIIKQGEHTRVRSSDLEFKIRWGGFSSTWEPYKNVRLNEVVIEYMRTNVLARFIPRNLEVERINTVVIYIQVGRKRNRGLREGTKEETRKKLYVA